RRSETRSWARKCGASNRGENARGAYPQVDHPRLPDLSGRRQTIQVTTAPPGRARPDPGAVSREMEPAVRLSNGCAQLRGAAVRVSEADRTRPDSAQSRRSEERRPAEGGQDLIALPYSSFQINVGGWCPKRGSRRRSLYPHLEPMRNLFARTEGVPMSDRWLGLIQLEAQRGPAC